MGSKKYPLAPISGRVRSRSGGNPWPGAGGGAALVGVQPLECPGAARMRGDGGRPVVPKRYRIRGQAVTGKTGRAQRADRGEVGIYEYEISFYEIYIRLLPRCYRAVTGLLPVVFCRFSYETWGLLPVLPVFSGE